MNIRLRFLIVSLIAIIIATSTGCVESQKLQATNETKIATPEPLPSIPEQKLPVYNETKPLKINDTFETWSRGYWSNFSYQNPYFEVIINYNKWITFLDDQGYFAGLKGGPQRLEGEIFPGIDKSPKKIDTTDFNNYFIIAAMMGRRTMKGPEIEIKNIIKINNTVNIIIREYVPRSGQTVYSAPYHIVIVKRELLPIGNSTFIFISTDGKEIGKVEVKNHED